MATKPISTSLYDFLLSCYRLVIFILFGNPLSMFVFNLLFPRSAAEFARNRNIFGEETYSFYEYLALKWPFHWSKWWMKLENLSNYTVEQQIQYLLKVAFRDHTEVKALKAIPRDWSGGKEFWPKAYEKLFFDYGRQSVPYVPDYEWDDGKIIKYRDWRGCTIAEFMMQNVRLSWNAFNKALAWTQEGYMRICYLEQYLKSGKLNDSQFELLVEGTNQAANNDSTETRLHQVLTDYIERYGISKELLEFVRTQSEQPLIAAVEKAALYHVQKKALKSLKKDNDGNDDWHKLCKGKSQILPEIQSEMSLDHYVIFHNNGYKLCIQAIKAFLSRPDQVLWRTVFKYEKGTCEKGEIREFIRSNDSLELAYRDFLEESKKAIRK